MGVQKNRILVVVILMWTLNLCWVVSQIHAQIGDKVAKRFVNSVIQLTAEFSNGDLEYGFGFLVGERKNKLYVVTADHVVRAHAPDVKTVKVRARFHEFRGESFPVKLLDLFDRELDLALLEVPKPYTDYRWEREFYHPSPERGDRVWFIGRNKKWWIPTDIGAGAVSKPPLRGELLVDILGVQPGTSGAPLITEEGIVGMITEDGVTVVALGIDTIRQIVTLEWNYPWHLEKYNFETVSRPADAAVKADAQRYAPATTKTILANVDRRDARATARAILQSFQNKDLRTLAELAIKRHRYQWLELAENGINHPAYFKVFSGWRWQAVFEWDGDIGDVRYRHYVGTSRDEYVANVKFADIELPEIAVVNMIWEDGKWVFEDIHSPNMENFVKGSKAFKMDSEPY